MRRVSFLASAKEFLWITFRKSIPFLLFASLDIFDLWDRYIGPRILALTGREISFPSDLLLLLVGLGVLFSAILTYHELKKAKVAIEAELEPTVTINERPLLQAWNDKNHGPKRLYYITVANPSARPLRGVSVLLTEIDPAVPTLDWLPIPLHIKHDRTTTPRESFAMNPRGIRHIDLVLKTTKKREIELCHTISGVNKGVPIQDYVLTVRVEGQSVAMPREMKFLVKVATSGELVCLPGQFVDLDKGLLEYRRDGEAALARTTKTLGLISDTTLTVGKTMRAVTTEVTELGRKSISWKEFLLSVMPIEERIIRRSHSWASRIDGVTGRLGALADIYEGQASEVIDNYIGFFQNAKEIELAVAKAVDTATAKAEGAITGTRNWHSKVVEARALRVTTAIGHSMLRLEAVLRRLLETHERMRDGFKECKNIAAGKIKP